MAGKTLVAYFSASGTTARVAREMAAAVGGDIFEIAADPLYTSADLNWHDKESRSSVEMADEACRPAIAGDLPDMSAYDAVLLGFPIWWYLEPRIVDSFIEAADLTGKRVAPFATSGGSGISGAEKRMRALRPDARWLSGRMANDGDVAEWARSVRA